MSDSLQIIYATGSVLFTLGGLLILVCCVNESAGAFEYGLGMTTTLGGLAACALVDRNSTN